MSSLFNHLFNSNKNNDDKFLNKQEEILPNFNDIRYSLSVHIWFHWYKVLFADIVWLNCKNKSDKEINNAVDKYIDDLINRWWQDFRKKIESKIETFDNIYDFCLFWWQWFFWDSGWKNFRSINAWTCLNLWDDYWDVKNRIRDNWIERILEENNTYMDESNFFSNLTDPKRFGWFDHWFSFIGDLLNHKSKEFWIENYSIQPDRYIWKNSNEILKEIETDDFRKKEYELYKEFCSKFSKNLLMDICFKFTSLDLVYDDERWAWREIGENEVENLFKFDVKKFIDDVKNLIIKLLPDNEIDKTSNKFMEKSIEAILTKQEWFKLDPRKDCVRVYLSSYYYERSKYAKEVWKVDKISIILITRYMEYHFVIDISSLRKGFEK